MKEFKILLCITAYYIFFASTSGAVVVDFDGGTANLQDGATVTTDNNSGYPGVVSYIENDVLVQFNFLSDPSIWESFIGDYYSAQNAVIHAHWGGLKSITFSMVDGSSFDLNYLDVTSNTVSGGGSASGEEDSWLTASNGASIKMPPTDWGSIANPQRLWLPPDFDNITSFTVTTTNAYCFGMDNFYLNEIPTDVDDADLDGIPDEDDNCLMELNQDQKDSDSDGIGDVCDNDDDNDEILDDKDNCPLHPNSDQIDSDYDGIGDTCDSNDEKNAKKEKKNTALPAILNLLLKN